jgi:hypothetical protein
MVVAGLVEAWGAVQLHADGFRAQYARPRALALIGISRRSDQGRLLSWLADAYRAELLEVASTAELAAYCRLHDLGLDQETVRSLLVPPRTKG